MPPAHSQEVENLSLFYICRTRKESILHYFTIKWIALPSLLRPGKFRLETSQFTLTSMAVVELKVGMHCDKCIKSIKKAIKKIDEMESYQLDSETNKITVTGNITTEEVVKALQKIGKSATSWSEE
ncbi:Heavy metal transport/detoxification superfamily protein [Rhynchospora pubera]|uniref:Heavy metal transport/detoxification superfamily protein n=2 Tax=Rhynchospora pubera TaxID=906938 RepID=A0AAV8HWP0_9POAL|nr:Heavy metal transport/detoxification superfamily protein [Rhynchospora pubera]